MMIYGKSSAHLCELYFWNVSKENSYNEIDFIKLTLNREKYNNQVLRSSREGKLEIGRHNQSGVQSSPRVKQQSMFSSPFNPHLLRINCSQNRLSSHNETRAISNLAWSTISIR